MELQGLISCCRRQLAPTAGGLALGLMTPAALTSFDRFQSYLGKRWRQIHLLGVPAAEWHSYSTDWFTLSR